MKKAFLLTALVLLLGITALYAQSPRAIIQEVRGTVELKNPGASTWVAAAPGQELVRESQISTGFKSSALIKVGNSTLVVKPLTRLSLGELQATAENERVDIQLRAGRVRANIAPPVGQTVSFNLRSPTATASVRGTVFEFDTQNLRVDDGVVHFSGNDNTAVYVRAGQSSYTDVATGKTAVPVETQTAQTPPPPAGVETVSVPATVIPGASGGDVTVIIDWDPPSDPF
jgi:hypothetical protein